MRLKEFRERAGLTTEKLGQMVGVSASAITNWETGFRKPDINKVCQLARILGCTPNDLLGFETDCGEENGQVTPRMMEENS